MAVRIRLQRLGRKKRPFYRVVVADSRSTRDGRFIEKLGYYNPLTDPVEIVIDEERALNWLHTGAQPSETARSLLSKVGILQKFHNQKLGIETPTAAAPADTSDESPEEAEAEAAPAPASEEDGERSKSIPDSESEN